MSAVTKLMTPGGGGVALTPASSIASDVTVNVPSQNCTLGIQGPAFSVYANTLQSPVSAGTQTKVAMDTELFDTANCFDTTNYRFTPNVAGYYQLNAHLRASGISNYGSVSIYVNGSGLFVSTVPPDGSGYVDVTTSGVAYFNGTTDYAEVYGLGGSTCNFLVANYQYTSRFTGALVRAA